MTTRISMRFISVVVLLLSVTLVGCSSVGGYLGAFMPGSDSSSASGESGTSKPSARGVKPSAQAAKNEKKGLRQLSLGNTNQAESLLRSALAEDSTLVAAREGLGLVYIEKDNYSMAETLFNRVLEAQPERSSALNSLGVLYDLQERFSESEKAYRAAIAANPSVPKYFNNLGYSYYLQGQFNAAKVQFNKAVNLDPGFRKAWANLALVDARTGDQMGAERSLEMIGGRHVAQNNLGVLNLIADEKVLAQENFESALSLAPRNYSKASQNIELMGKRSYVTSNLSQPRLTVMQAGNSLLRGIDEVAVKPTGKTTEKTINIAGRSIDSSSLLVVTGGVSVMPARVDSAVKLPAISAKPTEAIVSQAVVVDSSPDTVKAIQGRLLELGFHPDPVDGEIGDKTVLAIRLYKLAKQLPVNAEVTDELISALQL